jgi:DNA invertase Pin-like site-specific DNA recombinase
VFTDRPATVKKDRRPGETAMLDAIHSGVIDRVAVWSIDRVARSLTELVKFLEACKASGVSLWLDDQKLDTDTTNAVSLFDVAAMLAFHDRQSRRDRILRGQAAARNLKIRFGRPPIAKAKVEKAKRELDAGKGVRQVARLAGISAASVSRLKNSMNSASA